MPKPDDSDQREYVSRTDYERLRGDLEATQAALEEALSTSEDLQSRITELEPMQAKLAETEGKLRGTVHRAQFDREARDLGIPDDLSEDIWDGLQSKGGYKAESDKVDAKAMREALVKYVEDRPSVKGLLKKPSAIEPEKQPKGNESKPKLKAEQDGSRGGEISNPKNLTISRSRFKNDREYTKQMQKPLVEATRANSVVWTD